MPQGRASTKVLRQFKDNPPERGKSVTGRKGGTERIRENKF